MARTSDAARERDGPALSIRPRDLRARSAVWLAGLALSALLFSDVPAPRIEANRGYPARSGRWTNLGPREGFVKKLCVLSDDAETLLAAGRSGVFRSSDGGRNWLPSRAGIPRDAELIAFASEPRHRLIYAITLDLVLRSADSGSNWEVAIHRIPGTYFGSIAADPFTDQRILVGTDDGIYLSEDGGSSWAKAQIPAGQTSSWDAIAFDPSSPGIVLAAGYETLIKSTDGGETWTTHGAGLPSDAHPDVLLFDRQRRGAVYGLLGVYGVLYKSADGGATWRTVRGDPRRNPVAAFALDPEASDTIYVAMVRTGAIYRSADGGTTWHLRSRRPQLWQVSDIVVSRKRRGTLYVLGERPYWSGDEGVTWKPARGGPRGGAVDQILAPSGRRGVLYVRSYDRLYRSTDDGGSWDDLPLPDWADGRCYEHPIIAAVPGDQKVLYAGVRAHQDDGEETIELLKTADGGDSWERLFVRHLESGDDPAFEEIVSIRSIVVHPRHPDLVYMAIDGWCESDSACDDPSDGPPFGVYRSIDGGRNWARTSRIPDVDWHPMWVDRLAVDPFDGDTVYIGGRGGTIYRSVDGGRSWTPLADSLTFEPYDIEIDRTDPAIIYALDRFRGIFRSTDAGREWVRIMPARGMLSDIAIDPSDPRKIYVAGAASGLLMSSDSGDTWRHVDEGVWTRNFECVVIAAGRIYAGTINTGLWVRESE
ncbi:MAG: hypothetical protein HYX75_02685 [Acidobacteria bacterium]|nr:hypothetical protein [Acidobacteriota bacterium]